MPLEWDDFVFKKSKLTLAVKEEWVGGFQVNGQIAVKRDETKLSTLEIRRLKQVQRIYRSSHWQMFLKILKISQEDICVEVSF